MHIDPTELMKLVAQIQEATRCTILGSPDDLPIINIWGIDYTLFGATIITKDILSHPSNKQYLELITTEEIKAHRHSLFPASIVFLAKINGYDITQIVFSHVGPFCGFLPYGKSDFDTTPLPNYFGG